MYDSNARFGRGEVGVGMVVECFSNQEQVCV